MAEGFCFINITSVITTGSFNADPGDTGYNLQGTVTGGATIQIGGDDTFDLYDDGFAFIGTFTAATLPEGFQFINGTVGGYAIPYGFIDNLNAAGIPGVLNSDTDTQNAPFPSCYYAQPTSSRIVNWQSDFGWSEVTLFFDSSVQSAFLNGFELAINYAQTEAAFVIGLAIPDGSITNSSLTASNLPLNKFICGWDDNGPVAPPPTQPVTNPIINTTVPSITVTPPPLATTVTVTTPTTTITTVATPLTPVTIVVPPGTPIVTIIPGPSGGNPPPIHVPIDFNVSAEGLPIDITIESNLLLIGNPSGIYSLIPNQRFDVLYERNAGTTVTQTVQIPRPFGITSYVPEND